MSLSRTNEYRRMRPYLGTFVEIGVSGLSPSPAAKAVERAFTCIATVEARMSAHAATSDLGELYRAPANTTVKLHPWTIDVIAAARELHRLSHGVFDITVGNILARRKLLPSWRSPRELSGRGSMADFELLSDGRIRVHRPTHIDLGGIAKGFAVDRAMEVLLESRPSAVWVNAGGDMRTYGNRAHPLLVRDPATPSRILWIGEIQNGAVATSSGYFTSQRGISRRDSPLVDGRSGRMRRLRDSITVIASNCMWADGLTKVLALDSVIGAQLLERFSATAWVLRTQRQGSTNPIMPRLTAIRSEPGAKAMS